jgi:hypothetical protein
MPPLEIEEFAEKLVLSVRDRSIRSCDGNLQPNASSAEALRWKSLLKSDSDLEIVRTIVPDCVDAVLFHLLDAIDNGAIKLNYVSEGGKTSHLQEDGHGELAGWYAGSDSWRARFSQERFIDDLADLKASLKNFDFGE